MYFDLIWSREKTHHCIGGIFATAEDVEHVLCLTVKEGGSRMTVRKKKREKRIEKEGRKKRICAVVGDRKINERMRRG